MNNIMINALLMDSKDELSLAMVVVKDTFVRLRVKIARGEAFPNGPLPRART
jgi:hypothetical protein